MHTKKSDGRITMWNAVTGKSYSLNDENCQLQNIECIVTSKVRASQKPSFSHSK